MLEWPWLHELVPPLGPMSRSQASSTLFIGEKWFLLLPQRPPPFSFPEPLDGVFPPKRSLLVNGCESCLIDFLRLYLAFFRTILAASFRKFGLPNFHFLATTLPPNVNNFSFFFFLAISLFLLPTSVVLHQLPSNHHLQISSTVKPLDLSIHAWALKYLRCFKP